MWLVAHARPRYAGDASGGSGWSLGAPSDDEPLLGVITLENLGLMLNPFTRELQPIRLVNA